MENISIGNFAFTTRESGNYLACFWMGHSERAGGDVSVNLDWKTGIAAKDWDSVAKKEKIELLHLKRYFPQEKAYLDGASVDLILK
ncbi:hypothetical protein JHK87_050097 [Glycine soja]|nr:hypothetical protein JHK87_050097 [Glycine soja]